MAGITDDNLVSKIIGLSRTEAINFYTNKELIMTHPWAQCAVFPHITDLRERQVMVSYGDDRIQIAKADGTDLIPDETTAQTFELPLDKWHGVSKIENKELYFNGVKRVFVSSSSNQVDSNHPLAVYQRKSELAMLSLFDANFDKFIKGTIGHNSYVDTYRELYVPPTKSIEGDALVGDATYFSPAHFAYACGLLREKSFGGSTFANKPLVWIVPSIIDEVFQTKIWKDVFRFDVTGIQTTGFFDDKLKTVVMSNGTNIFMIKVPTKNFLDWNFNTADEDGHIDADFNGYVNLRAGGAKYASWLMTLDSVVFGIGAEDAPQISNRRIIGVPGGYTIGETISYPGTAQNAIFDTYIGIDELFGCMTVHPKRIVRLDIKTHVKFL